MDQRIADYIRDHRGTYTREALTQQLLDAGLINAEEFEAKKAEILKDV